MEPRIFRAAGATPYVTKDESLIVEIFHPATVPGVPYSVAEATVPPGGRTVPHRHEHSLETYYVLDGEGVLLVDGGRTSAMVFMGDLVMEAPHTTALPIPAASRRSLASELPIRSRSLYPGSRFCIYSVFENNGRPLASPALHPQAEWATILKKTLLCNGGCH